MARIRKTEPDIVVTAAGAAPARRKAAPAPRKTLPALTTASVAVPEYRPTREEIAAQAYSYWVERGYQEGCPEEDWLRAERELYRRGL